MNLMKTVLCAVLVLGSACSAGSGITTTDSASDSAADGIESPDGWSLDAFDQSFHDAPLKDSGWELPDFFSDHGAPSDWGDLPDMVEEGGFGWQCYSNADCLSNFCVPFGDIYQCTIQCIDECPKDWLCKAATNTFPDAIFICVPKTDKLCKPCKTNLDCAAQGDLCLPIGEGTGQGTFCGADCALSDCPQGYACTDIMSPDRQALLGKQCIPENNSCICSPELASVSRPCQVANQYGTCLGTEECKGAKGWVDCNAKIPSAEVCDGEDNDCAGGVDEGFEYTDWDGTNKKRTEGCGTGNCQGGVVVCGSLEAATCSTLNQLSAEVCNGKDDDCDGVVDDGVLLPFYLDGDLDGFGDPAMEVMACQPPQGYVALGTDCDDSQPLAYPGREESCDGLDNNCDLATDEGFVWEHPDGTQLVLGGACAVGLCTVGEVVCTQDGKSTRCTAIDSAIPEICDDLDQDCDGEADNGCDDDGDGYCDAALALPEVAALVCPNGNGDCDDAKEQVNPGHEELCNLVDDNCDDVVDGLVVDCGMPKCEMLGAAYFETGEEQCSTGSCVAPQPVSCGLYTCALGGKLGTQCAETCVEDTMCVVSAHCHEGSSSCVEDFANGHTCDEASDCKSGHCANGFCCTQGECCAQPTNCPDTFREAASCGSPDTCQGTRIDALCLENQCVKSAPVGDDTACDTETLALECAPYPDRYCAGTSSQNPPQCSATCTNDAQCDEAFHCDGTCQPNLADGLSCDEASDCIGNHCQNGFCCASGDCCATVADCPLSYSRAPSCDSVSTCQGTRQDATCVSSKCVKSGNLDDDTACASGQLQKVCNPYQPLICSGALDQTPGVCPTACTQDAECLSGYHCDGQCVANVSNGAACDENSDCQSNFCNNGFCCSGGTCCSQPSDCPAGLFAAPSHCDNESTCQGTRFDATCVNATCGTSNPVADDSACGASVQALDCTPYQSKYCSGAVNQTPPSCATGCTADAQCADGYHCDGTCKIDVENGGVCDEASDCVSNHCQNGFCCSGGDCCQVGGDCPNTYLVPVTCDSASTCQGTRKDKQCSNNVCGTSAPIADDTACGATTKALDCLPYQPRYCTGAANQSSPTCATTCTADSECQTGYHCDGTCLANLANGQACDEQTDCVSLHCQNGFCCGFGDCCSGASNCPVASYSEVAVCATPSSCQGTRRDPACVNSECRKSDPIADDSACAASTLSDDCGFFPAVFCNGGSNQSDPACATTCSSDAQCDANAHCEGNTCLADKANGSVCSANSWCTSGNCVDGVCCNTACTGTCYSCKLAGFQGTCSPVGLGQDPDGECGGLSCAGYYYGWSGSNCLRRTDVDAATATCDGAGACRTAAALCPSQGAGATLISCHATCQAPTSGTCQGTTGGSCSNINPGTQTCGVGECTRTVDQCLNGAPLACVAGSPTTEACDNKDQNCDSIIDNLIPGAADTYELNETCATNEFAGDIAELSPDALLVEATIYPQGDVDYYTFQAKEDSHVCFPGWPQTYSVTVRMDLPQAPDCVDYELEISYYDTVAMTCTYVTNSTKSGCQSESVTVTWGGTCAGNDSRYFAIRVYPYYSSSWECKTYRVYADMY